MKQKKLTVKQKRFADEYLIDLNATQACIRAGYSKKTATEQGSRLLANVNIKQYLEVELKKIDDNKIAKREEVLKYLTSVLRGESQSSVLALDIEGGQKTIDKTPDEKERLKAAELLGKYHSIYTDNTKITGAVPIVIIDDIGDHDD